MKAPSPIPLTGRQRAALLNLLTDDDPAVYQAVRAKILEDRSDADGWLRPHALSSDPMLRRRVQEILDHLARQQSDDRFLAFCLNHREDLDIEEAAWLLAQTRFPDINVMAYQALLDSHACDLRGRLGAVSPGRETLAAINEYLFGELAYRGNTEHYYEPDNSYLNRVMDRRTGNPISLCAIYLFLGRRLRLPVAGIGMPGHFLCRYQSPTEEIFIDAFHSGRFLTKADCVRYLTQSSYGFTEGLLAPATPRRILLRMCSNLHQIYLHLRQPDESARLQRYVVALAK